MNVGLLRRETGKKSKVGATRTDVGSKSLKIAISSTFCEKVGGGGIFV
jgi:hypothetical protein